jgi:FdrA protein
MPVRLSEKQLRTAASVILRELPLAVGRHSRLPYRGKELERRVEVRRNLYYDSVRLMRVSEVLLGRPGVASASTVMGTEMNVELLMRDGFSAAALASAGPGDLVIAVAGEELSDVEGAMDSVEAALAARTDPQVEERQPARWSQVVFRETPETNVVLIAVPGEYAALEAWAAIRAGRHAFIFSDNVPIHEEVALKRFAAERGLLVMGPDCGTAILGGVGLGFANRVKEGSIGLVGASGTGIQQVSCLVDAWGGGIAAAIGTGSHDLSAEVGGVMTRAGIDLLARDDRVDRIGLISKPGDAAVARSVIDHLGRSGKRAAACLLGAGVDGGQVTIVPTLARAAGALLGLPADCDMTPSAEIEQGSHVQGDAISITGLFCGGTLCQEALRICSRAAPRARKRFVDTGADKYTRGRAHPMIDPRLRSQMVVEAAEDTDVLLLDVVLGDLAHADPASVLVPAVEEARRLARERGRELRTVATLVGTRSDRQNLEAQRAALESARISVFESNEQAAVHAAELALDVVPA